MLDAARSTWPASLPIGPTAHPVQALLLIDPLLLFFLLPFLLTYLPQPPRRMMTPAMMMRLTPSVSWNLSSQSSRSSWVVSAPPCMAFSNKMVRRLARPIVSEITSAHYSVPMLKHPSAAHIHMSRQGGRPACLMLLAHSMLEDGTEEPKSSAPHNSHANAELSTGT